MPKTHEPPCKNLVRCQAEVHGILDVVATKMEILARVWKYGAIWAVGLTFCHFSVVVTLAAIYGPKVVKTLLTKF